MQVPVLEQGACKKMKLCGCGCGQKVKEGNRFVSWHSVRCISKDTRRNMSVSHMGKTLSDITRRKLSEALKGRAKTEEHKMKIREAQKGNKHPWYGRRHTTATLIKMSLARKAFMREHPDKALEICRNGASKGGLAAIMSLRNHHLHRFAGVLFDSREEKQAAQIICNRYATTPIEGVNCHVRMNGGEVDFRLESTLFVEYHPRDWDGLTDEQYYNQRRKMLDDNGYRDNRLFVAKSLDELRTFVGRERGKTPVLDRLGRGKSTDAGGLHFMGTDDQGNLVEIKTKLFKPF